jgi:hypothetical protein
LNELRNEQGGERQSPDQKILTGNCNRGWLENGEGEAIEGVQMCLTNQERLGCDVIVGSQTLGPGES